VTLIHEHIFVRNPELELNLPGGEWDPAHAVETAVRGLTDLYELGIRTVVDLTVPGLGRDVTLVGAVAERAPVNLVASTGWYTSNVLPVYFGFHGPGLAIDEPDPLIALFVSDIRHGIAATGVRAGMLKVMTDADGITPDVARVMTAAAVAHQETGVPITTHSSPASRNGLLQQAFLGEHGVPADRIIIGHCGDTDDLDYLRELMDNGSTIGMDRFGMEHVLPDDRRTRTVVALLERGYADRMVLSHDAAYYSHVTPPSWRAASAPRWRMDTISRHILPALRGAGVSDDEIDQMLIHNPRRLLEGAA
jgi:phosphotriesterase-related protein